MIDLCKHYKYDKYNNWNNKVHTLIERGWHPKVEVSKGGQRKRVRKKGFSYSPFVIARNNNKNDNNDKLLNHNVMMYLLAPLYERITIREAWEKENEWKRAVQVVKEREEKGEQR